MVPKALLPQLGGGDAWVGLDGGQDAILEHAGVSLGRAAANVRHAGDVFQAVPLSPGDNVSTSRHALRGGYLPCDPAEFAS